jgi:hypothetical protein
MNTADLTTVAGIVGVSRLIAKYLESIPSAILGSFKIVIRA